ncbi:RND multidrug efflux transporter [Labilithrix luteola]|uniref:RND multidrug efflux transporter n=1 Tax=Labilithrix luteola TaxID=1391654 RepID=A0A0K1Q3D6_9BACT|nr:efflux RND transporter permease subunit [Labilithrix luteola]AKV00361.1 RND multidrug efflux transporter [Labilithrix luteola]
MRALAALCIRRPVFTWVLVLACVVLGFAGLRKMPIERFPNVDFAFVSVSVAAPGMSAEQVESEISTRIENALGTVAGLERLDSTSSEGAALVWAQFSLDRDSTVAANDVRDRVSRLSDEMPAVARPARIETFNSNASPIMMIAVTSRGAARTPIELTELADTRIRQELQSIRGVGEVRLVGGEVRTLSVILDPMRLQSANLTAQEVQQALGRENLEAPGGTLADGATSLGVRLSAKARTASELEEVVVAQRGSFAVRVADVGRVEDGSGVPESRASLSGEPTVVLAITKQPGANTVGVADDVKERLSTARRFLPDGVSVRVLQDNSEDVRASVHAVTEHLVLGAVLAAVVVLLFLRSWRATLIAGLAIPSSILGTFAVAQAMGMTLNMLSLLGLTLAVGIVIDDAIVVLENIVRVIHTKKLQPREAAVFATQEIGLAVLATTLSLVAVFLPVATMEGIVGRYLAPFGLTMAASILLSMAVAFTLTPMLCSRWLKPAPAESKAGEHGEDPHGSADGPLERLYARALGVVLRWRKSTLLVLVLVIGSVVPIAGAVPTTFVPIEDSARLSVYVRLPEGTSLDRTAEVAEELSAELRAYPDVTDAVVTTTSAREASIIGYLGRRGVQATMIQRVREDLMKRHAQEPWLLMIGATDDMAAPGPDGAAIQFVVRGADLTELQTITSRLLEEAKKIPGTVDHGVTSAGGMPELSVKVDRTHASQLGVSQAEIGSALALVDRKGLELGSVRDPRSRSESSMKVRLRVQSESQSNDDLVRSLTVRNTRGSLLPLSEIAQIERREGPGAVRRVGRQRQITVFMNTLPGASDSVVVAALQVKLKEIDPSGRYTGEVLGNAKEMEKAFAAFMVAIALSFAFMYMILAAQYESWVHPVTILMSLPLTIPFGLLSLLLGGQSLNLFSALGFLVLFGVVKKNSILQVDRMIQLRAAGVARHEAVIKACQDRLRPILMTTLAFVAGMLPLVVSSGPGAATNRAIAVGVMGGQTLSLLLTLLATPVVYVWFDDIEAWWRRVFRSRSSATSVAAPSDVASPERMSA